jgi:hypothetical protein
MLVFTNQIHLVCMTCIEMYGNGVKTIGVIAIKERHKMVLLG